MLPSSLRPMLFAALAALPAIAYPVAPPAMATSLLSDDDDDDDDHPCMTSNRMRQFLASKGYQNIRLNSPIGSRWQAKVESHGQTLLVVVDTCRGVIVGRQVLGTN
ncbi:hypothetical protein PRN20_16130 [Devosia sp. ZB163]|uniref:hypothetical protein n=1 Tax=Devosia sp. ZB163 TaxID=3025938 RepID=UPI0023600A05|nr:hypothetical protein [Devosia sp. ZB163]MDC9825259.1 hypothetical protein [Devosia sp. ZB163]